MTQDYISLIERDKAKYITRWIRGKDYFTLENAGDKEWGCVVIFKESINDIKAEIEKLENLMQIEEDSKPKSKP